MTAKTTSNPAHPASGTTTTVAFVQSCWHREIVDRARDSFASSMARSGFSAESIDYFEVPGALELPLMVKRLAATGRYAAVVAAGLVVDGGIYRHDFVAAAVIDGLMRVQLDTDVPVLSAVLTPLNFHEHQAHQDFFGEHFVVKGAEVAAACVATLWAHDRAGQARTTNEQAPRSARTHMNAEA
ncbi:MAG: ribH 2 [Frankiales bacterium]|nr:ribH 2 [Frankiales bacterium]